MELNERETLVKVDQQLQDSVRNQGLILSDQKEIFNRIESEAKIVASMGAELRALKETVNLRLADIDKRLASLDDRCAEYDDRLTTEVADRKAAINEETKARIAAISDEIKARENFESTIKTTYRTTVIILGGLIVLVGGIVSAIEIIKFIKGM